MYLHKRLVIIEIALLMIIAAVLLIMSLAAPTPMKSHNSFLSDIKKNWNSNLIQDVVIPKGTACPADQEAVSYEYEGTRPFFLC